MAIPRLLNAAKVKIERLDKTLTRMDPVRREPVNVIRRTDVFEIDAQIVWAESRFTNDPVAAPAGISEDQLGYLIVKTKDLESLGKEVTRGDRITSLAGRAVQLYVLASYPGAHYGGKFSLTKIVFSDRLNSDG